jgi:hypothetical protein
MEDSMSAASSAQPQVRRNTAAAPSRSPQSAPQQHAAAPQVTHVFDFSKPRGDDEFRVNLADIPDMRSAVQVDVFAPTLLSRLFDLFSPPGRR